VFETRRHRWIWLAVGFFHLAALASVVATGSNVFNFKNPDEAGLIFVVLKDEAIVQPGEAPGGVAAGKGAVVAQAVDNADATTKAPMAIVQPAPVSVAAAPASAVASAKVESYGVARAEFIPPAFLIRKEPVYPEKTQRAGVEGRVVLRVFISATGMIRSTEVLVSSGDQALDQSALQAVRDSTFSPALSDRLPVESYATASYRFELR
jgi:TonB family protein